MVEDLSDVSQTWLIHTAGYRDWLWYREWDWHNRKQWVLVLARLGPLWTFLHHMLKSIDPVPHPCLAPGPLQCECTITPALARESNRTVSRLKSVPSLLNYFRHGSRNNKKNDLLWLLNSIPTNMTHMEIPFVSIRYFSSSRKLVIYTWPLYATV